MWSDLSIFVEVVTLILMLAFGMTQTLSSLFWNIVWKKPHKSIYVFNLLWTIFQQLRSRPNFYSNVHCILLFTSELYMIKESIRKILFLFFL